jgi:hypothetical protein
MSSFATLVEFHLQLGGAAFDRDDLLMFLEANRVAIDENEDAGEWANRFTAYVAGPDFAGSLQPV